MRNIGIFALCGALFTLSGCQSTPDYEGRPASYPTQVVDVNNTTTSSSSYSTTTPSYSYPKVKAAADPAAKEVSEDRDNGESAEQARGASKIPHYSEDSSS